MRCIPGQFRIQSILSGTALKTYAPTSTALIGRAGGKGFEEAAKAGVTRLVDLDINPTYIADAKARYAVRMMGLELYCADIEGDMPELPPVHMVYGALFFKYVDIAKALKNLRGICLSNGILATLLQYRRKGRRAFRPRLLRR